MKNAQKPPLLYPKLWQLKLQLSKDTHGPAQSTHGLTVTGCPVINNKVPNICKKQFQIFKNYAQSMPTKNHFKTWHSYNIFLISLTLQSKFVSIYTHLKDKKSDFEFLPDVRTKAEHKIPRKTSWKMEKTIFEGFWYEFFLLLCVGMLFILKL